jgi:16S rRNA (cytosine967-C5)-methyltransferase
LAIVLAKSKAVSPARLAASEILRRVEEGAFSSVLLASKEPELAPADRSLCHELVLGVLRWQLYLDKIVQFYAKRKIDSLDLPVLISLRLGLYQLRFLTRVPASAAVNESVNLVHNARVSSARAFVNAVLRRATREPHYDPVPGVEDPVERIAIKFSHPTWLIERWANSFGFEETEAFARANNQTPDAVFRVVTTRATEPDVLAKLRLAGATLEPSKVAAGAWRVSGASVLLRELAELGEIYLQDDASQFVAQVLNAQSGERVLDLCAAPGGKATLMAGWTGDQALVVAADLSARRLATVAKGSKLQQLKGVKLLQLDAANDLPFIREAFDRVLVDAPCSGTGTLRRNPEIRWRISAEDIQYLSARQKQFLVHASRVVKPGGRLVYSTCSVEIEENEEVVRDFMGANDHFRQLPVQADSALTRRTWPHHDGSDGFFVAAFERIRPACGSS